MPRHKIVATDDPRLMLAEDESFEMSNLRPQDTGLAHKIWISVDIFHRHKQPQIRVETADRRFYPLSISEPVRFLAGRPAGLSAAQFKDLQRFIRLNREAILAHWADEIDTVEAFRRIKPLPAQP